MPHLIKRLLFSLICAGGALALITFPVVDLFMPSRKELEDAFWIFPGLFLLPIAIFFIAWLVIAGTGALLVGLLAYCLFPLLGPLTAHFRGTAVQAYWVVRDDALEAKDWTTVLQAFPDAASRAHWIPTVPDDLPEEFHPQPGIRLPYSAENLRLARKIAKLLDGYVQERRAPLDG
jgi:hypothetical protein